MAGASAAQIGAIHSIAKRAGLDEESRRHLIASVAGGKTSCRELTSGEAIAVIDRLKGLQGGGAPARTATGRYAPKLKALWLSGWQLGVVRDRTDTALLSFLRRQTGLDHSQFLHEAAAATRVIEALKAWLAREAGVEWPHRDHVVESKRAVLAALYRRMRAAGLPAPEHADGLAEAAIDAEIRANGSWLRDALKRGRK